MLLFDYSFFNPEKKFVVLINQEFQIALRMVNDYPFAAL